MNVDLLRPPVPLGPEPRASMERPVAPPSPVALESNRALAASVARAHAGMAVFGVAMASTIVAAPSLDSLRWAIAVPALLACTWLVCLPALYIPWAGRDQGVTLSAVLRAAAHAFATAGGCLAATAPILWFFAITAPESRVGDALGFVFAWLALVASGVTFARVVHAQRLELPGWAVLLFFALYGVTFFQFSGAAGLRWFGA